MYKTVIKETKTGAKTERTLKKIENWRKKRIKLGKMKNRPKKENKKNRLLAAA